MPTRLHFAGIDLISERISDETTNLAFRHLLENRISASRILRRKKAHLKEQGMTMKQETIIDDTLIAAPSSTFTRAKPECAGGTRTRGAREMPRDTRPVRGFNGTTASRKASLMA